MSSAGCTERSVPTAHCPLPTAEDPLEGTAFGPVRHQGRGAVRARVGSRARPGLHGLWPRSLRANMGRGTGCATTTALMPGRWPRGRPRDSATTPLDSGHKNSEPPTSHRAKAGARAWHWGGLLGSQGWPRRVLGRWPAAPRWAAHCRPRAVEASVGPHGGGTGSRDRLQFTGPGETVNRLGGTRKRARERGASVCPPGFRVAAQKQSTRECRQPTSPVEPSGSPSPGIDATLHLCSNGRCRPGLLCPTGPCPSLFARRTRRNRRGMPGAGVSRGMPIARGAMRLRLRIRARLQMDRVCPGVDAGSQGLPRLDRACGLVGLGRVRPGDEAPARPAERPSRARQAARESIW